MLFIKIIQLSFLIKAEVSVSIGGSSCRVQSSSNTQIKCTLGVNSAGTYSVLVKVDSKGLSNNNTQFTYNLNIASKSHSQCNLN